MTLTGGSVTEKKRMSLKIVKILLSLFLMALVALYTSLTPDE